MFTAILALLSSQAIATAVWEAALGIGAVAYIADKAPALINTVAGWFHHI